MAQIRISKISTVTGRPLQGGKAMQAIVVDRINGFTFNPDDLTLEVEYLQTDQEETTRVSFSLDGYEISLIDREHFMAASCEMVLGMDRRPRLSVIVL